MRATGPIRTCLLAAIVGAAALFSGPSVQAGPKGEIRIIRDTFGVPHVFADNEEDASYGVGYALAQDRLWQMHVFRHIAKGELSKIIGPPALEIDQSVRFFTYTEEERAKRFETYPKDVRLNLQAFVDGINAWIDQVHSDPSLMPFEFQEYAEVTSLREWTIDDSLALQDVLILAFGSGGGNELEHSFLLRGLIDKFGKKKGITAFNDLIVSMDPDAPTTIPRRYPWTATTTAARSAEAESRRALERDARLSLDVEARARRGAGAAPAAIGTMDQVELVPDPAAALEESVALRRGLAQFRYIFKFGSNAQLAGPRRTEAGNTVQTGGPQVGYLLPQWLADFGIHGGSFNATGMTFAGAGPAVLIGRGSGYAWTTTTGASDLTDTYVERLDPEDDRAYEFNGEYEPMDCRDETYTFRGVPFDSQEICRTRHGPVLAFDEENQVAYSLRYSWFNREGQTVEGFFRMQEVQTMEDFATYSNYLGSNHNMFYSDDLGHFGYWHPGNHIARRSGVDLRLPQDGRGESEWQGLLPISRVPHAVDPSRGWLTNWNNQPAANWPRERAHPPLDNVVDLQAAIDPRGPTLADPLGGKMNRDGKLDFEDAAANLRYAAFHHHELTYFGPFLPSAKQLDSEIAVKALKVVRDWDGFNTDRDEDGDYDSAGRTILDRWLEHMRAGAFEDDLGEDLIGWAEDGLLWHILNPRDRLRVRFDWLGDTTPKQFARQTFTAAVEELAEEEDSENPEEWKMEAELEHYQRLNADLFTDLALGTLADNSSDTGWPGDVTDQIVMDRGTYNHVVEYRGRPFGSTIGGVRVEAGSVIPPGQSGFISPFGEEAAHYEDQAELYVKWEFKPMPMTLKEALEVRESEETIKREPEEG